MITALINFLKSCGIKQLSISTVIAILVGVGVVVFAGDSRYMLKDEGQQIMQYQRYELQDKLLIMKLREQGMTQHQIDEALKERWEERFEAMSDGSK